jgi:hypothetical protein
MWRIAILVGLLVVATDDGLGNALAEDLRYEVPNGQDPAPLMAALAREGYDAAPETVQGNRRLVIACPNGLERDRPKVRTIIEEANRTSMLDGIPLEREVRFEGEGSGR